MFNEESKMFRRMVTVEAKAKKDDELVGAIQANGDGVSTATLFVRYIPAMVKGYKKVAGVMSKEDYESECMEIFTKVVNQFDTTGIASFHTYLTTALHNTSTTVIRSANAKKRDGECDYLEDLGTFDEEGNRMAFEIEDETDYAEQVGIVTLIDSLGLTEQQRNWVNYCLASSNPSQSEFAEIQGITRQSVAKMCARLEKKFSGMKGVIFG